MKDKIMPTIVLTIICVIASVLLVFANEQTKDSIAEQKELKFSKSVEALFGDTEIKLIDKDFGNSEIKAVAVTSDGRTAVQVCTDGYSKDGINVLIGIEKTGRVSGIEFISLGETPGLGSKVRDDINFRAQFMGNSDISSDFDAISGATFSSNGMKHAVETALEVYINNKEALLNG
ncbi:MAG: FMN-binding protein [Ruminococcus sp.]|nr:FMN-binding protein [Ruminococcus sp.]